MGSAIPPASIAALAVEMSTSIKVSIQASFRRDAQPRASGHRRSITCGHGRVAVDPSTRGEGYVGKGGEVGEAAFLLHAHADR